MEDVLRFVLEGDHDRVVGTQTVHVFDQELRLTWNKLPTPIQDGLYAAAIFGESFTGGNWLRLLECVSEQNRTHVLAEVVYKRMRATQTQPWWLIDVCTYCNTHLKGELPKYVELARPFVEMGDIMRTSPSGDFYELREFVEKFDEAVAA